MSKKTRILFVCMGNICRSPSAEVVFRALVQEAGLEDDFEIDSAGTHAYHVGHGADPRSCAAAKRRQYDLSDHRARRVEGADYERFDLVLAMDCDNLALLKERCPKPYREKLRLFLEWAPETELDEVPDPYYREGEAGFEQVLDLVEAASRGLMEDLKKPGAE